MNAADKVTSIRIVLAPVFFAVYSLSQQVTGFDLGFVILLWLLFGIMELSDLFDGIVARKLNQVSDFGKLLDPFADVISRITYFVCFVMHGIMPFVALMIVLYREFSIFFIRLNLTRQKVVMGAKWSGKVKAWVYAFGGIWGLIYISCEKLLTNFNKAGSFTVISLIMFGLCAAIAVISLTDYFAFFLKVSKEHKAD